MSPALHLFHVKWLNYHFLVSMASFGDSNCFQFFLATVPLCAPVDSNFEEIKAKSVQKMQFAMSTERVSIEGYGIFLLVALYYGN